MSNEDLKRALQTHVPVVLASDPHRGQMHFAWVSAIIYRCNGMYLEVTAEVTDRWGKAVYIVDPKNLEFEEE